VEDVRLLRALTEIGRELFGAAACSLALLEPDDEHLVFRAASGAGADDVVGLRLPINRGIAGWVVSSGQSITVQDVRRDPRFARDIAESTGYVPRSITATPIVGVADVLGVIEVLDGSPDGDPTLLALLARHVAAVVEAGGAGHPELVAAVETVAGMGIAEQRAAAALLRAFAGYARERGGPAGLV
jgi:GAF domain-containing protein